jgi:uncharacterized DUF497 family protein
LAGRAPFWFTFAFFEYGTPYENALHRQWVELYAPYAYNKDMSPEFDPRKNAANIAKHGVSLATGDGVLHDPLGVTIEDSSAVDEHRWITVGTNSLGSLMVVIWTERAKEVRLISVRSASPKERKSYEKGI